MWRLFLHPCWQVCVVASLQPSWPHACFSRRSRTVPLEEAARPRKEQRGAWQGPGVPAACTRTAVRTLGRACLGPRFSLAPHCNARDSHPACSVLHGTATSAGLHAAPAFGHVAVLSFAHFSLGVLCTLWIKPLVKYMICKCFLQLLACLFILLTFSQSFKLGRSQFASFSLSAPSVRLPSSSPTPPTPPPPATLTAGPQVSMSSGDGPQLTPCSFRLF